MNCQEANELLHDWVDGELDSSSHNQLSEHLASCKDCKQQSQAIKQIKQVLLTKAKRPAMPAGLEDRIRASLAKEYSSQEASASNTDQLTSRNGDLSSASPKASRGRNELRSLLMGRSSVGKYLRIAALTLILVLVGQIFMNPGAGDLPLVHAQIAKNSYEQHLLKPLENPLWLKAAKIKEGLMSIGVSRPLPEFDLDRVRLIGASPTDFSGHDAVHMLYEVDGEDGNLSVFILPCKPAKMRHDKGDPGKFFHDICHCNVFSDFNVMCFCENDVFYFLVTDIERESFYKEFLVPCREKIRASQPKSDMPCNEDHDHDHEHGK